MAGLVLIPGVYIRREFAKFIFRWVERVWGGVEIVSRCCRAWGTATVTWSCVSSGVVAPEDTGCRYPALTALLEWP